MKKRILALPLVILLLLSGCTAMLERDYGSVTSHVDYSVTEDSSILRVESYQALVNSILYFVGEHSAGGTIRLYNYTGNVETDLDRARGEVMSQDPMGAYAVRDISWNSTRILTYYEVELRISYRHTAGDVAAIRTVSGLAGLRGELARMVVQNASLITLHTSYFSGDAQAVNDLFWLAYYGSPSTVLDPPAISAVFYPETATQRILEIEVHWPAAAAELEHYAQQLEEAGAALTGDTAPAGEQFTVQELAALLHDRILYDPSGSHTALDAMQGSPVNDLGILLAMEQLCLQHGIEASPVYDSAGAQMWLIVSTPSGYRHLLPRDLRPQSADGESDPEPTPGADPESPPDEGADPQPAEGIAPQWQLPLYTDEDLAALGFDWPRDLHPACVDYSGGLSG